jgi:hypothetical protein
MLAHRSAKSSDWREIVDRLRLNPDRSRRLMIWRLLTWAFWGFVNPVLWWVIVSK